MIRSGPSFFWPRAARTLLAASVAGALSACGLTGGHAPVENRLPGRTAPVRLVDPATLPGAEFAGKPGYYTVQPGDTIRSISRALNVDWRDLAQWNSAWVANPDTIEAGAGTLTDPAEILRMAVDQKPFFGRRGGVTFSGGEPTFQAAELVPLVKSLKEAGIHVCIDSNGGVWNPAVEELLGLVDLVLLDIKQADPERHRTLTGRDNAQTLRTAAWLEEHGKPFWLRYVLVPGYSDAEADIRALGERLGGYKQVERVEILPYHTLGVHKYEAMGKEYRLAGVQENTPEQSERAAALFREYFPTVVVN